jgi:hypothetical protein
MAFIIIEESSLEDGFLAPSPPMTLRQQVTELLKGIPEAGGLVEILGGRQMPPLTDYRLRPISEGWNAPPPPELVDGMKLLPAFTTGDWFTVYCIEENTGRFFAIDPECPWPPSQVFASCGDFLMHLLLIVRENESEDATSKVREFLRLP